MKMSRHAALRICREISQIEYGTDLSLAVASGDIDVRYVRALIIGPMGTPYQFGFFEFMVTFTENYPDESPSVRALSTNGGTCRLNPNIYANGKICLCVVLHPRAGIICGVLTMAGRLSANGRRTYSGGSQEQWTSAQCLESLLVSIQSLMSEHPYRNEPGYSRPNSDAEIRAMENYTAKVRHESLRLAVVEPLECILGVGSGAVADENRLNTAARHFVEEDDSDSGDKEEQQFGPDSPIGPNAFNDLRKRMFLWYFECYKNAIAQGQQESVHQERFEIARFEYTGNLMAGRFNYPGLHTRLHVLKDALWAETLRWSVDWTREEKAGVVHCLQGQFEQITVALQAEKDFSMDLRLVDNNPFLWHLTYFGRPLTQLDGGVVNVKLHMSPRFPDEQPRVFVDPPIFHCRVSPTGVLCYTPERENSMQYHLNAIVQTLENEPQFDPRKTVNPEASRLFWGEAADRRQYNRKLRQSFE